MGDSFTDREEREIRTALARRSSPPCPRCGGSLQVTPVPPRPEVAYVRSRVMVECRACVLRAVVDRK